MYFKIDGNILECLGKENFMVKDKFIISISIRNKQFGKEISIEILLYNG